MASWSRLQRRRFAPSSDGWSLALLQPDCPPQGARLFTGFVGPKLDATRQSLRSVFSCRKRHGLIAPSETAPATVASLTMGERLLNVTEAAAMLGLKPSTLYQWAYERRIA